MQLTDVDELAHCAVRLGSIKLDCSGEADGFYYELREFADGEFLAGADVDVAVADFAERRDGAAAAGAVVAVNDAVGLVAVVDGGVFLYAYDVLEINVQEDVHAGIGHILAPEEFAQRRTGSPKGDPVVGDAVESENLEDGCLIGVAVNDIADGFSVLLDVSTDRTYAQVLADGFPIVVVDEFGQIDLAHHRWHHV